MEGYEFKSQSHQGSSVSLLATSAPLYLLLIVSNFKWAKYSNMFQASDLVS